MMVWFKCTENDLMVGLDTDTKPSIGDTVLIKGTKFVVDKVIWCLEEPPAQSGFLIEITKAN